MNSPVKIEAVIGISDSAAHQIACGRLWIFSNDVFPKKPYPAPGTWCHFENRGKIVATGYYNSHSLIAGRVVSQTKTTDLEDIIRTRVEQAFLRREKTIPSGSCRLLFSESDFLPGVIIDYYSGTAVIQANTAGADTILPFLVLTVPDTFNKHFQKEITALIIKADSPFRTLEGIPLFTKVCFGDPENIKRASFTNQGVIYAANFLEGQKTGFFLDQTDNRRFLAQIAAEKENCTVLDLFSYSGGWGLQALKSGAAHVTFVDSSQDALELVRTGLALNEMSPERSSFVCSDALDYLEKNNAQFDIIVSDPPAFAKSKKDIPTAVKGYEKLNRLAWRKLKTGGILLSCSCSFHICEPDFMALIQKAVAREKSQAHVVFRGGQSGDHPILLSMPETQYLKCVGLRKLS